MSDKNYLSFADVSRKTIMDTTLVPLDDTYADTLKLSHADFIEVIRCVIYGGHEDCIDINRDCVDVLVKDCRLIPDGKYAVTIKGGSCMVHLQNVVIDVHGSETDIDIGNWSDQSGFLTTGVVLENVTMADGSPVRCRVLWGEKPMVVGGNVKVTVVPKVLVWGWRVLRKLGVVK